MAYTHEQVKNIFANAGCELLSQYYTAKEAVQYRCSCGTISFISLSDLTRGKRCKKMAAIKQTLTQEYVSQYFKDHGCELLDIYIHNQRKVKYLCSCGHIAYIAFNDFNQGHRCRQCGNKKIAIAFSGRTGSANNAWKIDRVQVQYNATITYRQSVLLHGCLARLGTSKEGHIDEILGYSAIDLDTHLRSFSQYNYLEAIGALAIDHILPVKAFIEHGIIDPAIICALDNLQPLSKSENSEKSDWYLEADFINYCQKHNISLLKEAM